MTAPLVHEIVVRGFRSAGDTQFAPGPLCALVGEAHAGKSNLLAAIRAVLDPQSAPLVPGDVTRDGDAAEAVRIRVTLTDGWARLEGVPPDVEWTSHGAPPPVFFLPAAARGQDLVAPFSGDTPDSRLAAALLDQALAGSRSDSAAAQSLAGVVEAWCDAGVSGLVVLIEEPELFLGPQAQRYLYRVLRRLTEHGNQVLYSTHSPAFLNVARLDELVFVRRHDGHGGTRAVRARRVSHIDALRIQSEFDAERTELFLARAAILVEGQTERLALPFVFAALGLDPDREGISIIECGGKSSMPLIAEVGRAAGVPLVVIHDRDAPQGRKPSATHRDLNAAIARAAGAAHTIVLTPDFEGVAGLRGHDHKPQQAWRRFASLPAARMPEPLTRAVLLAVRLAGPERRAA